MADDIPLAGAPFVKPQAIPLASLYDPLAASAGIAPAGTPTIDQINWGQPSWLEQAAALHNASNPNSLRPSEADIDFASGILSPGSTKAVKAAEEALPPLAKMIRAYHGSPHDFDKFDISKIGTGEGAQAYGHGLYMAENEAVARQYRDALSTAGVKVPQGYDYDPTELGILNRAAQNQKGDKEGMLEHLRGTAAIHEEHGNKALAEATRNAIQKLDAGIYEPYPPGRMYEVNIGADPEHFLDWDRPVKDQSAHVKSGLSKVFGIKPEEFDTSLSYPEDLKTTFGSPEHVQQLRDAGIPGIKYLDQGSRVPASQIEAIKTALERAKAKGDDAVVKNLQAQLDAKGTSNYVVFDDKLIDIIKKYGLAGLLGGGGAGAMMAQPQQKPRVPLSSLPGTLQYAKSPPSLSDLARRYELNEQLYGPTQDYKMHLGHGPQYPFAMGVGPNINGLQNEVNIRNSAMMPIEDTNERAAIQQRNLDREINPLFRLGNPPWSGFDI